jgi:tetratricopeptide (TPR) repeat protein
MRKTGIPCGSVIPLLGAICAFPALAFQSPESDAAKEARAELFAARYDRAIDLYRKALAKELPPDGYYGLTRALLRSHKSMEAYAAAEEGLQREPQTADAQTAAGLALFRKGDIVQAEDRFKAAVELDPRYCGALSGLAAINTAVSNFKTARDLLRQAYEACPGDPALMLAHANTLKGPEHIVALENVLAQLDPESEEARGLRSHIGSDRAFGDRKARRLVSAYAPARIKLEKILATPTRVRGFGVRVSLNDHYTATLLLDTGASGISVAPRSAQKAGLELLSNESVEAKGIGDEKPQDSLSYLASEVRIGNVVLCDYPISVFSAARNSDFDGVIGVDVFQGFLVTLDFPTFQILLEPFSNGLDDDPQDYTIVPEGFHRVLRAGNHLLTGTSVNDSPTKWFLIDSGCFGSLLDTDSVQEFAHVHHDASGGVRGVQGNVNQVSRTDHISLVFAGFHQENPSLIAISLEKTSDAMGIGITGVLGMPVLSVLKLTIDYRAGAVRFERPK